MRSILISLLLILAVEVMAWKCDKDLTFNDNGPAYVFIADDASGGYRTNLKEERDYVIGQVETRGRKTVSSYEDVVRQGIS